MYYHDLICIFTIFTFIKHLEKGQSFYKIKSNVSSITYDRVGIGLSKHIKASSSISE